jgi:flagellar hook-associated protein 1 FlgK
MAVSALMTIGSRALMANYGALQTTGNNIANANTIGYSRQNLNLQTSGQLFTGGGYMGRGVDIVDVSRAYDAFTTREASVTRAAAAEDAARSEQLNQLEKVFPLGETGMGHAAGQFFNAFVDVVNRPADLAARQMVLARADDMCARFRNAGEQIETLQMGVSQGLRTQVDAANALIQRVAQLNNQIMSYRGFEQRPLDLLDKRDQAVSDLNQFIQVSTIPADDGTLSLMMGNGQQLLLGVQANPIKVLPGEYGGRTVRIAVEDSGQDRVLPTNLLQGGSISGLVRFQDVDLVMARNTVGQMAAAIATQVNQQQALGVDQGVPPAQGSPIFDATVRLVTPSRLNAKDPTTGVPVATQSVAGQLVPSVSMTISKPAELQASDYELVRSSDGYRITRLSDGKVYPPEGVAAYQPTDMPVDIDGMHIDINNSSAPRVGDRFLLQPVSAAAGSMNRNLSDPKGIAAASPVQASVNVDNKGTAKISTVNAVSSSVDPALKTTLTFGPTITLADGTQGRTINYTIEDTTGTNSPVNGSLDWAPGVRIHITDPSDLGWEVAIDGVPSESDTLVVEKTKFPASNNGNAQALLAFRDARMVGQQTLADGTVLPGDSPTDAYANLIAKVGTSVQTARNSADQSSALMEQAKKMLTEKIGVNLDEEAARLIQFQQSYQAAAKVLQVAQSLFDNLLDAVRP